MAQFNPFRPAYQANPYPYLARLREEEPVHRSRDLRSWVVTRYADAISILQDDERFSSDPANAEGEFGEHIRNMRSIAPLGDVPLLGNADPPVHTRLRSVVNRGFTPRIVSSFGPQVEDFVEAMLAPVIPGQPWEAMSTIAEALPVVTSLAFLGIPADDVAAFRARAAAILRLRSGEVAPESLAVAEASRAAREMTAYLEALRKDRRGVREDSVLAALLQALDDREDLSVEEVAMLLIHIASSGNGPTALGIGNALLALADNPEQFARVKDEPGLAADAVEESLRYDSPTHVITRFAKAPLELGGKHVATGDTIHVVLGAANRDPAQFPEPDEFQLERTDRRIVSFGFGIHFCLGAPLARLEMETLIRSLARRFDRLVVDRSKFERRQALLVRGPRRLVLTAFA